jgi:hypothetical protein
MLRKRNASYMRRAIEKKANRPRSEICEGCDEIPNQDRKVKITVFDHDHRTGKFRGWLCSDCNKILGLAHDNPMVLRKLAIYLEVYGDASDRR